MSSDRIKTIEDRLRQLDVERKALADELISIRSQSISQARPLLDNVISSGQIGITR